MKSSSTSKKNTLPAKTPNEENVAETPASTEIKAVDTPKSEVKKSFTVVAIGASAGGLEAITQLLQNMFYRTDIGLGWYEDSDKLQTWGYLY